MGWATLGQVPGSMRPHVDAFSGRLGRMPFVYSCLMDALVLVVVATTVLLAATVRWLGAPLAAVVGGLFALFVGRGVGWARGQAVRRWPGRRR